MVGARSHDPGSKAAPAQCSGPHSADLSFFFQWQHNCRSLFSFFNEDLLVVVRALLITLMTTLLRPHSPDLSFFVCFDHVLGC